MIVRVYLQNDELERWAGDGRDEIIERVRQMTRGDDIESVKIHYGVRGEVLELGPSSHAKMAARLRELGLHDLANFVDPKHEPDIVRRQKVCDQLHRYGVSFGPKDPMGGSE